MPACLAVSWLAAMNAMQRYTLCLVLTYKPLPAEPCMQMAVGTRSAAVYKSPNKVLYRILTNTAYYYITIRSVGQDYCVFWHVCTQSKKQVIQIFPLTSLRVPLTVSKSHSFAVENIFLQHVHYHYITTAVICGTGDIHLNNIYINNSKLTMH